MAGINKSLFLCGNKIIVDPLKSEIQRRANLVKKEINTLNGVMYRTPRGDVVIPGALNLRAYAMKAKGGSTGKISKELEDNLISNKTLRSSIVAICDGGQKYSSSSG